MTFKISLLRYIAVTTLAAITLLSGCSSGEPAVLRLATTTSTYDSGLLDAILPGFEKKFDARVDVIAVGTGQAIKLGENGDADVILVHDRTREDAFVEAGHGTDRYSVMYNDFVIVGPPDDPAGLKEVNTAVEALGKIMEKQAKFVSRGDQSGTHSREMALWKAAGKEPDSSMIWYFSIGQGMGETLQFANEQRAYTLTDRGTYLSQSENLPELLILVGGESIDENPDPGLYNDYGVIPINPEQHEGIQETLAKQFVEWLLSEEVQKQIGAFGLDTFGQPLFYPNANQSK
jgi:tungstate transport system substrate-binding protein